MTLLKSAYLPALSEGALLDHLKTLLGTPDIQIVLTDDHSIATRMFVRRQWSIIVDDHTFASGWGYDGDRVRYSLVEGAIRIAKDPLNELRVVQAVQNLIDADALPWVQGVWRAESNSHLDQKGVDVVVMTSCGELYLQVKSSRDGVRAFQSAGRRSRLIGMIMVGDLCSEALCRVVQEELTRLWEEVAAMRGAQDLRHAL